MSNVENVSPQVLRGILKEVQALAASPPPGIKLVLHDDDLTDIIALIDGPAETPYWGGVFRVRVSLGPQYPATAPRAFFLTKVFHPNVREGGGVGGGEVCVDTLRRGWRPELGLAHALAALRCLLIAPNADSALNAEAAALLRDNYAGYCARARLLTEIHALPPRPAPPAAGPAPSPTRDRPQRAQVHVHGGGGGGGGAEEDAQGGGGGGGGAADGGPQAKRERRAGPEPGPAARARDRRRILKRL